MLEDFIETKLAKSLHRVPKERRCPTLTKPTHPRFPQGHTEAVDNATVFSRVDLDAAFDQIQGNHCRVCYATAKNATKPAQGIVLCRAIFTAVVFSICNVQQPAVNNSRQTQYIMTISLTNFMLDNCRT